MKAKAFLYAAAVAAVSLSCTREAEESGLLNSGIDLEFTAEWADEKGADSRTVLQEDGTSIWWTPNEEINVFFGTGASGRFVSTNTEPKPVVSFYGTLNTIIGGMETEGDKPVYWAVYPYSSTNTCDGQSVSLTVPYNQTGTSGTFADKFFPAVACGDSYSLAFYNVCGGACFSVTQEDITKIIFRSNDGSPMAGKVKVGFGGDNKPQILEIAEPVDSIVVNAPEGGFIPGTNYFAAMLPQAHVKGMTISLSTQYKKASRTLDNAVTVHRSSFGILDNLDEGLQYLKQYAVPEMVDLGLPSGLKWASFNLGATAPEEYGDYYAWGEIEPDLNYDWSTYKWCMGSYNTMTKYCSKSDYGYNGFTDNKTVLDPEDDAAAVNLGGSWRMATFAEWDELQTKCTWTWTTQNGVEGRLVTGSNGNSIFLPAAGYRNVTNLYSAGSYGGYWSSSLGTDNPGGAYYVGFSSDYVGWSYFSRYGGFSVRPVYSIPVSGISLNKSSITLNLGESESLTATIYPLEATNRNVNWSSSDTSIATVDNNGLVSAVSVGTAVITTTTVDGGFTAKCTVTVEYKVQTPDMVDLGLPSGLKWASFNLGATKPEEYGDYFAWGETEPKEDYSWSTYKWCMNGSSSQLTKYCYDSSYGYNGFTDNKTVLDPEDDAATVALGGSWRMPTKAEQDELRTKCTWTWTTQNGVRGRLVTGPNGNSIFLPAAGYRYDTNLGDVGSLGYYWSSSLSTGYPYNASFVYFGSSNVYWNGYTRDLGFSVRPVYSIPVSGISLNKSSFTLNRGESESLIATIYPSAATNRNVNWSSSDTSIATVDANGLVIAVSFGTAVITTTTVDGGFTAECTVTVEYKVQTPDMVDLGLPSGLKWASFNLGATKPEEYGDYFAWGEVEPKTDYSWSTYKWSKGSYVTMTKYCTNSSYGYNGFTDNKTILDPEDDAAAVNLGGSWRMPTTAEQDELISQCTWTWTTQNGVNGRLITGPNGNSIFLPAGYRYDTNLGDVSSYGAYLSSSLYTYSPDSAYRVYFNSGSVSWSFSYRYYGFSVRPVSE